MWSFHTGSRFTSDNRNSRDRGRDTRSPTPYSNQKDRFNKRSSSPHQDRTRPRDQNQRSARDKLRSSSPNGKYGPASDRSGRDRVPTDKKTRFAPSRERSTSRERGHSPEQSRGHGRDAGKDAYGRDTTRDRQRRHSVQTAEHSDQESMRDQLSVDPNSATSSQENDDGVGDTHIVEFVGEPVIVVTETW